MLGGTVDDFVNSTCCTKEQCAHLCWGVGQCAKNPSFFKWRCVRNECEACGVAKLGINKCDIWNKCELEADVLEWVHADQQGSKNGKQNTQLELGKRRYKIHVILSKLIGQLEKC